MGFFRYWYNRCLGAYQRRRYEYVLSQLRQGELEQLISHDQIHAFHEFVRDQAAQAGCLVLAFERIEGGIIWFCYEVVPDQYNLVRLRKEKVTEPKSPTCREPPDQYKGCPIWRLDPLRGF
ncbi:hypothetical protein ACFLZY_02065 [Patescibacteria group bacterium]